MNASSNQSQHLTIAVAGGTGTVGAYVVDSARAKGHDVVVLSRSAGVDLVEGTGLARALRGVDVVIDVSSKQTQKADESRSFFGTVTRHLLAAEKEVGVSHHVALSVVGVDDAPEGYYAGKVLQEELVTASDVPWTILRATQFHEFAEQIFGAVRLGPLVVVPKMVSRPVAAREVAARLVELAESGPSGRARDLRGPRSESMTSMVRGYARAAGLRGRVVALPLPGVLGKAMRDGTLTGNDSAESATETFDDWLAGVRPS